MGPVVEREPGALLGAVDAPAREDARDGDHVLLRVPAIHAECVQLEQLARVVLVQTARRPPPPTPPPPPGGGGRTPRDTPGTIKGKNNIGGPFPRALRRVPKRPTTLARHGFVVCAPAEKC